MTITLDGKTLNVRDFDESVRTVRTEWDAWEGESYVRKVKVYGTVKTWVLECFEEGISWSDSAAKHFQEKAEAGNFVSFLVSDLSTHSVITTVYILNVEVRYEGGISDETKYRVFTVHLQEA